MLNCNCYRFTATRKLLDVQCTCPVILVAVIKVGDIYGMRSFGSEAKFGHFGRHYGPGHFGRGHFCLYS